MLLRWSEGDAEAFDQLIPVVYEHLKRLARARLRDERRGHTLNTTGLVHEAYLRLVDINRIRWVDRNHFMAVAARAMRRILIDHANRRRAQKRGGGLKKVTFQDRWMIAGDISAEQLLALDVALRNLESRHPRPGRAIELHYFGGLTQQEVAGILGISQPTVARDLQFARAWLAETMNGDSEKGNPSG